jgi:hypothetical protein
MESGARERAARAERLARRSRAAQPARPTALRTLARLSGAQAPSRSTGVTAAYEHGVPVCWCRAGDHGRRARRGRLVRHENPLSRRASSARCSVRSGVLTTSVNVPPTGPIDIAFAHDAFPPSVSASWSSPIPTTWAELVAKAITVGQWHKDLFGHGKYSAFEAISRAYAIWAYVRPTATGAGIRRTSRYDALDPSEKGAVSYLLGMITAVVAADALLGAAEMVHLTTYAQSHHLTFTSSRRPDLIGLLPTGGWVVAEAKGRSGGISESAITSAVNQKASVASINGQAPEVSFVSLSHFTNDGIAIRLHDPPAAGIMLDIGEEEFLRLYYEPLADLVDKRMSEEMSIVGVDQPSPEAVIASAIAELDVVVGLDAEIYRRLRSDEPLAPFVRERASRQESGGRRRSMRLTREASTENSTHVGADGVAVVLGEAWRPENPDRLRGGRV